MAAAKDTTIPERAMQAIRGRRMSMIFQEPQAALDPLASIGSQIAEALRQPLSRARPAVRKMLEDVGISDPERQIDQRPFELSGGMCQRVMIASALISRDPPPLIADEPTTALDVTIQAQILDPPATPRHRAPTTAVVLITHDMGVVADIADRLAIMYAGPHRGGWPDRSDLLPLPAIPIRRCCSLPSSPRPFSEPPQNPSLAPPSMVACPPRPNTAPALPLRQSLPPARGWTLATKRNPETAPHRPSSSHCLPPC